MYMYIDIGERIAGKNMKKDGKDGPSLIMYGPPSPPPPPWIAKNAIFSHWGPYTKNLWLFFPLLYICLLCDEVLLTW